MNVQTPDGLTVIKSRLSAALNLWSMLIGGAEDLVRRPRFGYMPSDHSIAAVSSKTGRQGCCKSALALALPHPPAPSLLHPLNRLHQVAHTSQLCTHEMLPVHILLTAAGRYLQGRAGPAAARVAGAWRRGGEACGRGVSVAAGQQRKAPCGSGQQPGASWARLLRILHTVLQAPIYVLVLPCSWARACSRYACKNRGSAPPTPLALPLFLRARYR